MSLYDAGIFVSDWLRACWQVFQVPIWNGLTIGGILIGVLFVNLSIFIFRHFFDLTDAEVHKK